MKDILQILILRMQSHEFQAVTQLERKTTAGTGKGASIFETLRRIKGSGMLVDKKDEVQKNI